MHWLSMRVVCVCVWKEGFKAHYSPARADFTDALVRMFCAGRLFDRLRLLRRLFLRSADVFNQHNGTVDDVRTGDRVFRGGNVGLNARK